MWTPISYEEIQNKVLEFEAIQTDKILKFWFLIKIEPEKWDEKNYGKEGGGFWVVALIGRSVMWYNDIEDGFNISKYNNYGVISEYGCAQLDLKDAVDSLWEKIGISAL